MLPKVVLNSWSQAGLVVFNGNKRVIMYKVLRAVSGPVWPWAVIYLAFG